MSGPRYRPPKRVFEALCRHYTRKEIAEICEVTPGAVSHWQEAYGCKPVPAKPGPKRRSSTRARPAEKRLSAALHKALHTTCVD